MQLHNILTSLAAVACTLSMVSAMPAPDVDSASPSANPSSSASAMFGGGGWSTTTTAATSTPTLSAPTPNFVNLDRQSKLTVSWNPTETVFDSFYTAFPLNVYSNETVLNGYMDTWTIWADGSLSSSGSVNLCTLIYEDFGVTCPVWAHQSHEIGIEIPILAPQTSTSTTNTTVHGVYLNARTFHDNDSIFQLAVWASDAPMPPMSTMSGWVSEHAQDHDHAL